MPPLPFKGLKPESAVEVAGFTIRKRGCLTIAEEQAVRDMLASSELGKGLDPMQEDLLIKLHFVTILIQSRLDRSWTIEKTRATEWEVVTDGAIHTIEPDMEMVDALYDFFTKERLRDKTIAEAEKEIAEAESKGASKKK